MKKKCLKCGGYISVTSIYSGHLFSFRVLSSSFFFFNSFFRRGREAFQALIVTFNKCIRSGRSKCNLVLLGKTGAGVS